MDADCKAEIYAILVGELRNFYLFFRSVPTWQEKKESRNFRISWSFRAFLLLSTASVQAVQLLIKRTLAVLLQNRVRNFRPARNYLPVMLTISPLLASRWPLRFDLLRRSRLS